MFVTNVEVKSQDFSEVEWKKSDARYTNFSEKQYHRWGNVLTPSEKTKVNILLGKYQALKMKRGIEDIKSGIKNVIEQGKTIYKELSNDTTKTK